MDAIRTTGLTKYYGRSRGITNLDLTVKQGEFFGFIGPNGAGKSTTIRTLLGLIRPTDGKAEIFDLSAASTRERRKILARTGYLPSEAVFYPGMRVRDILKLSADLRIRQTGSRQMENGSRYMAQTPSSPSGIAQNAALLCERLQLDSSRKVEELSFGNRKKVGIVCALQHNPDLLILDEPTSGLDPLMQKEFFAILRKYNEAGTTIFLSSHILSEIQHNCTRAAIIRDGRIIACDSVKSLSQANAKRVSIRGHIRLDALDGVRNLQTEPDACHFLYNGEINALLSALSEGDIRDVTISEPDLEEIFMHYYENQENTRVSKERKQGETK